MTRIRPKRDAADYADLLELPHPVFAKHPPMPLHDRAAQFAPYDALTGYSAMVRETARLTDDALLLDDTQKDLLNLKLRLIQEAVEAGEQPIVQITHFVPDRRKQGGAYDVAVGAVKRIDPVAGRLILVKGREIALEAITELHGELLATLDEAY